MERFDKGMTMRWTGRGWVGKGAWVILGMLALAVAVEIVLLLPPFRVEAASPAAPAAARAAPGQLVRWSAPGTERCGRGSEVWAPEGETCWYPVDLLADQGPLTVLRWRGGRRESAVVEVGAYPYEVQHITLQDRGKVDLSAEDAARARRESAKVGALWGLRTPRRFTLPLHAPLEDLPGSGRFGARRFFNGQPRSPHSGADYAAAAGTPVLAAAPAKVVLAEEHFFSGKSVFLDHGDGLISMYFHLSGLAVREGDEIQGGEIVGLVGSTGRATGPHLHFGIRWRGARVDPELLLNPGRAVEVVEGGPP